MADDIHKQSAIMEITAASGDIDIENDSDELLAQKIELRLGEGKGLYDAIMKEVQENEQIFLGNIDRIMGVDLAKYKSKAVLNRVYLTIRNMVGLDTDNLPKVQMIPGKDTPPSIKKAEKVKNAVEYGFIRVNFMDLITKCIFDTRIKRDSFARWFWNYDKNDFDLEGVMIEEITFSAEGSTIQDCEWLVYHPLKNRKWWKDNYPAVYDQIAFENVKPVDYTGKGYPSTTAQTFGRGTVARFYAYWENDLLIEMAYGKNGERLILKKSQNPYYEYRDPFIQVQDWAKEARPEAFQIASQTGLPMEQALPQILDPQDVRKFKPIVNFLSEPRKPFVQFPSLKLMGKMYSSNLMAQAKETLTNYIGKKRQIADNLRGCNVKIVVDSNQFNEDEAAAINDEPMQVIRADMQQTPNPVQVVAPTFPELQGVLLDMNHDEKYIDDLWGHHEISRGSGNANTLGQDKQNAESDRTPVRMQSRATESAIKEITEGWIQLMKMFYTEKHWVKKLGGKEGVEMAEMINQDIEEGIEPLIIPQSMMKVDKVQRAISLWSAKALDPYTLFKELEMPNPKELADRLINFIKFGIISDQDPEEIQADMQNQAGNGGDMTNNPVERADSENKGFQNGDGENISPTPREFVTKEHVALHFAFFKDPEKKMEQRDMDLLEAHANVDKATLIQNMAEMAKTGAQQQINEGRMAKKGAQPMQNGGKPMQKGKPVEKTAAKVVVNVKK
jgi:hypothetical protein